MRGMRYVLIIRVIVYSGRFGDVALAVITVFGFLIAIVEMVSNAILSILGLGQMGDDCLVMSSISSPISSLHSLSTRYPSL